MTQSLSRLFVHITFHVKRNKSLIPSFVEDELYAYIGSVIKSNDSVPIIINGVSNHIHILCIMSKNIALSKLVEEIKRHSSRWIKTKSPKLSSFAWQGGYGAFSVSASIFERTKKYIENQKAHHKRQDFKQEYLIFLNEYGIDYNEDYLWRD